MTDKQRLLREHYRVLVWSVVAGIVLLLAYAGGGMGMFLVASAAYLSGRWEARAEQRVDDLKSAIRFNERRGGS